jgi:opacity protein-like surface antigen
MMRRVEMLRYTLLSLFFVFGLSAPARAQGFISPFVGVFGGDSSCPSGSDCEEQRMNWGLGFGALGRVVGFEGELSYAPNFLGEEPGFESDMFTLMGNLLVAPKFGPVRPYGVIGLGLMRSTASLTRVDLLVSENNNVGWDFGGGLMLFFGDHVGIRGEIRRFQSLQDVSIFDFELSDSKIEFARVSGALVFVF